MFFVHVAPPHLQSKYVNMYIDVSLQTMYFSFWLVYRSHVNAAVFIHFDSCVRCVYLCRCIDTKWMHVIFGLCTCIMLYLCGFIRMHQIGIWVCILLKCVCVYACMFTCLCIYMCCVSSLISIVRLVGRELCYINGDVYVAWAVYVWLWSCMHCDGCVCGGVAKEWLIGGKKLTFIIIKESLKHKPNYIFRIKGILLW